MPQRSLGLDAIDERAPRVHLQHEVHVPDVQRADVDDGPRLVVPELGRPRVDGLAGQGGDEAHVVDVIGEPGELLLDEGPGAVDLEVVDGDVVRGQRGAEPVDGAGGARYVQRQVAVLVVDLEPDECGGDAPIEDGVKGPVDRFDLDAPDDLAAEDLVDEKLGEVGAGEVPAEAEEHGDEKGCERQDVYPAASSGARGHRCYDGTMGLDRTHVCGILNADAGPGIQ